jgi:hypothetical protein
MDSIRAVGSELLQGKEKHNRLIELMGIKNTVNESKKSVNSEDYIIHAADGKSYGIFRENKNFFVKYANKHTEDANDFEYIGGLVRKTKELHESYSDAFKRLNVMIGDINQKYGVKNPKSLFEADKQYMLQPEAPTFEAPASAPTTDAGVPTPAPDASLDTPPVDASPAVGDNTDENDPVKMIQSLTGKLGQSLRDNMQNEEVVNNQMIKYVLNSVLSAIDLNKLTPEDKEELNNKILGKEEQPASPEGAPTEIQSPESAPAAPMAGSEDPFAGLEQATAQAGTQTESLINLAVTYEQELALNNLLSLCENKNIKLKKYRVENDNIIFESTKGKRFVVKPNGVSLLMTENKEYKKLLI